MQALHLLALDPVAETTADKNSYGFRQQRSCADAIQQCFNALTNASTQWILEGDIRSCFDRISHDWLLAHVHMDRAILQKWLQSGYMDKHVFHETTEGTPQGGIVSPALANMAVAKDGRYVYVGIIQEPGGVDVIDTTTQKRVKNVPTKGTIHNAYVTPDGKYVVAGSIAGKTINVIDAKTHETAFTVDMDLGVRPMTFNTNPDGSTKWIFAQLSGFNGFAVVDFATKKEIKRIQNPDLPPGKQTVPQGSDPSHGMRSTRCRSWQRRTSTAGSCLVCRRPRSSRR